MRYEIPASSAIPVVVEPRAEDQICSNCKEEAKQKLASAESEDVVATRA